MIIKQETFSIMIENDKKKALEYFFELSAKMSEPLSEQKLCIDNSFVHKVKSKNVVISDIAKIESSSDDFESDINLYYSIACPNFKCEFIFDHPLDHYSFMLLLESARQMSIGVTHKYMKISINSIKNTVSNVDLKIHRFAELDYPLMLGYIDHVVKNKRTIQVRDLYFFFIQKGKLCAEVKSAISVMTVELYNRYRTTNRQETIGKENVELVTNVDIVNQNK